MKAIKLLAFSGLLLAGCTSYQPLLVPSSHPASVEQPSVIPWTGPASLTRTQTEVEEDESEMPMGSGHNHKQMHGGH